MPEEKPQKKPLKVLSKFKIEGQVLARNTKKVKVKNKKLKASSKRWLERHINDEYTTKAQVMGYRARSAFKLLELNEKFDLFHLGGSYLQKATRKIKFVLDLGCAPGGWCQVILRGINADLTGVDLLDVAPLEGLRFIKGDFCNLEVQAKLAEVTPKFDLILSDIAPNTTGKKAVDSTAIFKIVEDEWEFARKFLAIGGCFAAKVFAGGAESRLLSLIKSRFQIVRHFKPKASRSESGEFYIVCLNFLG